VETESSIQHFLYNWRYIKSDMIICPGVYIEYGEADLFSITRTGYSHEFEIKISKSDFKADLKKPKHKAYGEKGNTPNYFWYCCPKGLLVVDDMPNDSYGLLYIIGKQVKIIRRAKLLHKNKCSDKQKQRVLLSMMHRYWQLKNKIDNNL